MSLLEQFARELQPLLQGGDTVHGGFESCRSWADAGRVVARLADERGLDRLVLAPRPEFSELQTALSEELDPSRLTIDENGRRARDYTGFDAGVGGAEVLVAESASVGLLTPGVESPLLSLLPPTHIVVAPESRMVPRIHDAMSILADEGGRRSRSLTFITGPSRTADIEKILVLPAHGPAHLYVIVIEGV